MSVAENDRPIGPALLRGARRRCPRCGEGRAFSGFLSLREACPHCGQSLSGHRADDAPAWATMLVVGHLMVPIIFAARTIEGWPDWAHMTVWPSLALAFSLLLLPRVKGVVVAYQWAHRMHGFGEAQPPR